MNQCMHIDELVFIVSLLSTQH